MKKIATLCWSLMIATAALAEMYGLSYEGFPYNSTRCGGPTYAEGSAVKLTEGTPTKAGAVFLGWQYGKKLYQPGTLFTMPAEDVVLKPIWAGSEGIDEVESGKLKVESGKILRDGQLIIVRDGVEYNILGGRIQ